MKRPLSKEIDHDNSHEEAALAEEIVDDQEENASNADQEDQIKDDQLEDNSAPEKKKEKKLKQGIIYLSSIPKYMNVALVREYLSPYGSIGRLFLQPDKKFCKYI